MNRTFAFIATVLAFATVAAPPAAAQQEPMIGLKVDLVLTRMAGDKKVASMPYTMWVAANDRQGPGSSLRVGSQVPVTNTRVPGKDEPAPPAYAYRDIGTNIDCRASSVGEGRFVVRVVLNDSSLHTDTKDGRGMPGLPVFRNLSTSFNLLLRDGQTATYTSAVDPVTGELLKIDVTMTVQK